jgi:serine/threonine protein kinase/WD40 repeat protein
MPTLTPNGDDDVIAAFINEFGAADDRPAVVRRFSEQHPHLATAFADYAGGISVIRQAVQPAGPAPHSLRPGEMLGDFRVVRFVTHGGMGEIYEAEQVRLSKRRVALKVIRNGYVTADARDRFLREQAVLARLHQSNIVPVFAAGERDRLQYFAMPYIDGATLGNIVEFLRHRGRVGPGGQTPSLAKLAESAASSRPDPTAPTAAPPSPPTQEPAGPTSAPVLTEEYLRSVASSLADVADALDAAHAAHFVHRDVKPSNLMVEKSGKCWVIDFGLAGLVGESVGAAPDGPALVGDPALTGTGSMLGTPAYMAPEQFEGRADRRSDVWSLGVTLYELLALARPFPGPTRDDFRRQIAEAKPAELRSAPPDLSAICRKAMRKEPCERYQAAGDFAADLRRWLRKEPTIANPPWVWRRMWMWAHRNPGWAVAVAATVAVVGLVLLLQVREQEKAITENKLQLREQEKAIAENKLLLMQAEAIARDAEHQTAVEKERLRVRSQLLLALKLRRGRAEERQAGWRAKDLADIRTLSAEGQELELQDGLSAITSGLDAYPVAGFSEGASGAVLFDPTGDRLLMAGLGGTPTRVRNLVSGEVKTAVKPVGGPIAWRGTVPVQLVFRKETPALVAWDVDRNSPLEEFALPEARVFGFRAVNLPSLQEFEISSDASHVAAVVRDPSGDLSALVWRTGTPEPVVRIALGAEVPGFSPHRVALSPDGSLLALGSDDGLVVLWSVAERTRLVSRFELGRNRVTSLGFARHRWLSGRLDPKGAPGWLLAAGDSGGQVVVWDLGTLASITRTRNSKHEVFGLAFGPDAVTLYATGRMECRCFDVRSGRQVLRIGDLPRNVVAGVAVSPTNKRLALCTVPSFSPDGGVDLFDLEWGRGVQELRGLTGQVSRLTITPDGKFAAGLTQDWQIGVWNCESGEMLMAVDAPLALYADHDDIRLTDDGKFLLVAGGKEAHRWEVPTRPNDRPREAGTWKLNPAWSNRLSITPDGRVLLGRNETRSGSAYPNEVRPKDDPRCVRIYELIPNVKAKEIAQYDDLAWHVFKIEALPTGGGFIADGIKTGTISSREIIGYSAAAKDPLWQIPLPNGRAEGGFGLDSTGTVLTYWTTPAQPMQRMLPYRNQPDSATDEGGYCVFGRDIVVKGVRDRETGLHLFRPGAPHPFLSLSPDDRIPGTNIPFTADGRYVVWGSEDGTVHVGDLAQIRRLLTEAGFPAW